MKKVCILTSVHPHDDIRIFHRQAKTLAYAGYQVVMLCGDYQGYQDGIEFIKVDLPQKRTQRILSASTIFYRKAVQTGAQIFHLHDPELLPAGLRLAANGFTVVYDIHEDFPLKMQEKTWIPKPLQGLAAKGMSRLQRTACRKFALSIAATPEIAAGLPNCISLCNYPEETEFATPHLPFEDCQKRVSYVGAITANRGAVIMAQAAQRSSAKFALAGRFESLELYRQVMSITATSDLDYKNVLNRQGVGTLLAQSCAGLLVLAPTPAYRASMPIKLFEYMLAGVPVIASNFPKWRALAGDDCAIYIDPLDVEALAKAMDKLINNPALCARMGQAGRQRALKHFTFAAQARKLLQHYHKLP